jgi:hypothetical protein
MIVNRLLFITASFRLSAKALEVDNQLEVLLTCRLKIRVEKAYRSLSAGSYSLAGLFCMAILGTDDFIFITLCFILVYFNTSTT